MLCFPIDIISFYDGFNTLQTILIILQNYSFKEWKQHSFEIETVFPYFRIFYTI